MKNIKLFLLVVGVALIGLFTGCESDKSEGLPVTISFTNTTALDSVYDNDPYTVTGTVTTDAKIQTVQFFSNYYVSDKEMEVEIAGSEISNVAENPYSFSVNVPPIQKDSKKGQDTKIRVVVTQVNGDQTSAVYTIKSGRKSNILISKDNWAGGYFSWGYGSFYRIADFQNYSMGIETNHPELVPLMDFYFADKNVGAVDLDYIDHNTDSPFFEDLGTRFEKTTFTAEQFDKMRDDDLFKSMEPTLKYVDFKEGDVFLFKTRDGKKGLVKLVKVLFSTDEGLEDYNFDVKVQK